MCVCVCVCAYVHVCDIWTVLHCNKLAYCHKCTVFTEGICEHMYVCMYVYRYVCTVLGAFISDCLTHQWFVVVTDVNCWTSWLRN